MVNSSENSIHFHFLQPVTLHNRTALKRFLIRLFKNEGARLEGLSYIFCSDKYLLNINQQYLKHDFYTDIITFDLSDKSNLGIQGEIYISIDRVRNNAKEFNVSLNEELHRVIFHGALHLCGYNDKKKKEAELMRKKENLYLTLYKKGK
jgi:probable rRNA maturation factor